MAWPRRGAFDGEMEFPRGADLGVGNMEDLGSLLTELRDLLTSGDMGSLAGRNPGPLPRRNRPADDSEADSLDQPSIPDSQVELEPTIHNHDMMLRMYIHQWEARMVQQLLTLKNIDVNYNISKPLIQLVEKVGPREDTRGMKRSIIGQMLSMGADMNAGHFENGETLPMLCFRRHSFTAIDLLLSYPWKEKVDVEATDCRSETSLFFAIRFRKKKIDGKMNLLPLRYIQTLIEMGSSLKHRNVSNYQPLDLAVELNDVDCAALLLDRGAVIRTAPNPVSIHPPLVKCSRHNMVEMAKLLLIHGGETDAKKYRADTPIYTALATKNLQVLHVFAECGSNFSLEPYLFDLPSVNTVPKPEVLNEDSDLDEHMRTLSETPTTLKRQVRTFLWGFFREEKIALMHIRDTGIPTSLANYITRI